MSLLLILAVMLGIGASAGRDTVFAIGKGVVRDEYARVRKGPSVTAEIAAVLKGGQEVFILAEENDFYQIVVQTPGEALQGYMKAGCIYQETFFQKRRKIELTTHP